MYINCYPSDELYHHGIKGQKWGVRRFQNSDGSLTSEGRSRYSGSGDSSSGGGIRGAASRATGAVKNRWNGLSDKQKKFIKGAAITAGVALAAYGGYKLSKNESFRAGAAKVRDALRKKGRIEMKPMQTNLLTGPKKASRFDGIREKVGNAASSVKGKAGNIKNTINSNAQESAQWFKNGRDIGRSGGSVESGLTGTKRNDTIARAGEMAGKVGNRMRSAADRASNTVRSSKVGNKMRSAADRATNTMRSARNSASRTVNRARDYMSGVRRKKGSGGPVYYPVKRG